ncbi:DUF420 domain-containing protein [Tundrisphaera sp. TA3]|uniref:DUF420 domain-containing protein n=1 Tax=Tundrisphaera sp. TA3 TaxID=3435775 RepID=UPI003EB93022
MPKASYRLGLLLVAAAILGSLLLVVAGSGRRPASVRAGRDLGDGYPLGSYKLNERSGKSITEADLAGDVWVAAFIFTRCPSSCPRISAVMKSLQQPLGQAGVRMASITVDPDHDTPAVLADYAKGLGADPNGWWFLTGPKSDVYDLILKQFKLPVSASSEEDQKHGAEAVAHSNRLVLVDRGNAVVGVFDSTDKAELAELVAQAKRRGSWARDLPAVNAALNGTCALLLVIGWILILTKRVKAHAICMISAVVVSAVFLACYLVYHYEVGSVAFRGVGAARTLYFTILLSHTILATFGVVPLVALTLTHAIRSQFARHAAIARVTFPIWLYVSVTGVVIYWMLYRMPVNP